MPDQVEVMRGDVADQFSDELDRFQCVEAFFLAVPVVFEFEGDHLAGVVFDPKL